MQIITGIPASKGIAIGPGYIYQVIQPIPDCQNISHPQAELERFHASCERAATEIDKMYLESVEKVGQDAAEIFQAHLMMLKDPELVQTVENMINNEEICAEYAMYQAAESAAKMMEDLEDPYFRARAADIRDVVNRVIRILQGYAENKVELKKPSIIIAEDLAPSDTMQFNQSLVLGFCIARGGDTSHTAILSKAMGIPAVVGAGNIPECLKDNTVLIIDGNDGKLIINPDEKTLFSYRKKQIKISEKSHQEMLRAHEPAVTKDGHEVEVVANIGNRTDAEDAITKGAEGVGLLRTEFSFIEQGIIPDEDALVKTYQEIFSVFGDHPVVVRTLDIGGDKDAKHLALPVESNPFLGCRGIRLCFNRLDLFLPQLRAILRAGLNTNLHIMFPMVAFINEVRQAQAYLKQCMNELEQENLVYNQHPKVGIMIEVPSAAVCADQLAPEVDFFSIGTNDLTQYCLAVDRTNASVAHLGSSLQPAVLRLISKVIKEGHAAGIWVGMCGELAGDLTAIPILLGLGLDEFSITPPLIPAAKEIIRNWDTKQAILLAEKALACESPEEVSQLVKDWQS